jgi:hypothetical protein
MEVESDGVNSVIKPNQPRILQADLKSLNYRGSSISYFTLVFSKKRKNENLFMGIISRGNCLCSWEFWRGSLE